MTRTVHRIGLTQASPEGENSAYLLPERGLLVDPGPPGDASWDELVAGVRESGHSLSAVDRVFVTHWHADHAGNAVRAAEAADATLHMHADDAPLVGDYARERRRRVDRDARRLREWGVPDETVDALRSGDTPSPLPDSYPVVEHEDSDEVAGLTLLSTPGHTLGHAALVDPASGALFAGDALLPTYTPNVGGGDTRQTDPLASYYGTLDALADAAWSEREVTVYPGHGSSLDYPERLHEIREHAEARTVRVREVLEAATEPLTPWAVATTLFGEMRAIHVKMGAGEAAAHLTWLANRGEIAVVTDGEGPATRYLCAD